MTDRPILFSGEMVRAILDGRKTQTRRIVKPQPVAPLRFSIDRPAVGGSVAYFAYVDAGGVHHNELSAECRYGQPGDRLWVRESLERVDGDVAYKADGEFAWDLSQPCEWVWKRNTLPSIHCPRGLSRITLEVVAVRVERVQAISEADAIAEGLTPWRVRDGDTHYGIDRADVWEKDPRLTYARLWDKINGKRAPWASKPWVWVVEFKRVLA